VRDLDAVGWEAPVEWRFAVWMPQFEWDDILEVAVRLWHYRLRCA